MSKEQVNNYLLELFQEKKIVFVSQPGPIELGAEPISTELNWVDLP